MRGDRSSHLRPVNSLLLCGTKRKLLSLTGFPIDSCSTLICSPRCIGTVFSKCNYDFDIPLPKAHQLCHVCMSCSPLFAQTHRAALCLGSSYTGLAVPLLTHQSLVNLFTLSILISVQLPQQESFPLTLLTCSDALLFLSPTYSNQLHTCFCDYLIILIVSFNSL